MLWFNLLGFLAVYALQRLQDVLPLNPQKMGAVSPDSSFNTAVSFATNTNWQGYGGETTMSYLTQMLGLAVQNFVSAATGMAVLVALMRGFARKQASGIGNFWVDLTRSHALHPAAAVAAARAGAGVAGRGADLRPYKTVQLVQALEFEQPKIDADGKPLMDKDGKPVTEKVTTKEQTLPLGPAASQIAIKQLGTNGGGFFNVNSAHPFENPTPLSNFLEMLAILLIPAALCYTFGHMVGDTRQGWAMLAAMTVVFVGLLAVCVLAEQAGNPVLARLGVDQRSASSRAATWKARRCASASPTRRSGRPPPPPPRTARSTRCTTPSRRSAAWCRCVLMQLGEVIFGGVGSGCTACWCSPSSRCSSPA